MSDLTKRLRKRAAENMELARTISNLRSPETDNEYGRDAALLIESAARIASLEAALRAIENYPPRVLDSDRVEDMQDIARAALAAAETEV